MTNAELKTALRDDTSTASGDSFYSDAYLQRVANRCVMWLCDLHPWQQTQYGYTRDSVADQEYYNYPEDFKTDSLWQLIFNGERYIRKSYAEYIKYQKDYGVSATEKYFTDFQRQFFINPAPTVEATIEVFGHIRPAAMSADGDTHPFAGEADFEEAMLKYGLGIILKKGRGTNYERGVKEQEIAISIVNKKWEAQKKEQAKYNTINVQQFNYFDILPPNGGERRTQRGNFIQC